MKKNLLNCENYLAAFEQVTEILQYHQSLWRHMPFVKDNAPWQGDCRYEKLYQVLLNLSDDEVLKFNDEDYLVDWFQEHLSPYLSVERWPVPISAHQPIEVAKFCDIGMPGRKKQQIEHFVGAFAPFHRRFEGIIPSNQSQQGVVDWCCGKGHLAAHLHRQLECFTLGLEYDEQLVAAGRANAASTVNDDGLSGANSLNYECVDVLKPIDDALFSHIGWHTGLHACGDLHVELLKKAVKLGHDAAIAPCCYHLVQKEQYQPLSIAAKRANLVLSKDDLRLAVLQTVTSGKRVKRIRQTELLWRTGFDLWYREYMQLDHYTHQVSLPKHWFSGRFVDFCRHLAEQRDVCLPEGFDGKHYLHLAEAKMAKIKRVELARLAFRPVMELWLLLDRVLFMQEQGYQVDLMTFCDVKLTPRNSLIIARLRKS